MSYRLGLATLLMRAACKEVHEKLGITPLVLVGKYKSNLVYIIFAHSHTEDENIASKNFFLQLGFTQQDEIVIWYGNNKQ